MFQGVERDDIEKYKSKKEKKEALEAFDKYKKSINIFRFE